MHIVEYLYIYRRLRRFGGNVYSQLPYAVSCWDIYIYICSYEYIHTHNSMYVYEFIHIYTYIDMHMYTYIRLRRFGGNVYSQLPYAVSCWAAFNENKNEFKLRKKKLQDVILSLSENFIACDDKEKNENMLRFDPPVPEVSVIMYMYIFVNISIDIYAYICVYMYRFIYRH
jgi:hypothetical protein